MKKTLFVTDLDGTLLRRDLSVSDYTKNVIEKIAECGELFTYATARSDETASVLTKGLMITAPRVLYNGAFICDNSGQVISSHLLDENDKQIITELITADVYPIVYSLVDNSEKFSFIHDKLSGGGRAFVAIRENCKRYNPVFSVCELTRGKVFYLTCIDDGNKLEPFYKKYKDKYNCVYSNDIYTGEQWLEIISKTANKAEALTELKRMLDCRLVVFGDGKNDIDMFKIADECYATENAVEELKAIATAVIESNEADGVAKQIERMLFDL